MTTEFIAFDVETTGLSPLKGHRVIEIGAVMIADGRAGETYHSLIDSGRPLAKRSRRINGITDAMLQGAPSLGEVFQNFRAF